MLEEQQQAVNDRVRAIYQKAQTRLGELVRLRGCRAASPGPVLVCPGNWAISDWLTKVID